LADRIELSGHRGARGLRPENTLPGFLHALALGVDTIELDVMLSADSAVVVTHDLRLNPGLVRDADGRWLDPPTPAVRDLPVATLRVLDVGRARPGGAVALRFPRQVPCDGARIPLLAEVLALGAALDIELKTQPDDPASCDPLALADAVLAMLGAARPALRSFDFRALRHVRRCRPDLPLAWLTKDQAGLAAVLAERPRPGDAWAPEFSSLSPDGVAAARAAGLLVKPWTVNRPEDAARLVAWGVDGICTDDPDLIGPLLHSPCLGRMICELPAHGPSRRG
jgi:glycerophosphoryl diester phosphodiesterase